MNDRECRSAATQGNYNPALNRIARRWIRRLMADDGHLPHFIVSREKRSNIVTLEVIH